MFLTMTTQQQPHQLHNSSESSILATEMERIEKRGDNELLSDAMELLLREHSNNKTNSFVADKQQDQGQGNDQEEVEAPPLSMEPQEKIDSILGGAVENALTNNERPVSVSPAALEIPTIAADIDRLEKERSSPMPNLSVSPLTASSYHVMEREYNRDTWRMYRRIASSRPSATVCVQSAPKYNDPSPLQQRQRNQQQYLLSRSCNHSDDYDSPLYGNILEETQSPATEWGQYIPTEDEHTTSSANNVHTNTHIHTQTQSSNRSSSTLDVQESEDSTNPNDNTEEHDDDNEIFDLDLE